MNRDNKMVGDVLKNLVIGLIALVLIVAGGFYIKKYIKKTKRL